MSRDELITILLAVLVTAAIWAAVILMFGSPL